MGCFRLMKKYMEYRYDHALRRKGNITDGKLLALLNRDNEEALQENANKNPVINSTTRDYMAGEVSRDLVRRYFMPEDVMKAHDEGIIHVHDTDYISGPLHNCDLVNLEDMLQNGTVISGTMIEKPHSFFTACNVTTQIVAQVASNQYGGQSFTLSHLAPFVDVSRQKLRKEVEEELKEGKGIPAKEALEEIARKYGFPVDEEDERQDALKRRIIEVEVEYSRYCHWRERKRILECAGFEAPEYSSHDEPEGIYAVHFCEMPSRDCARVWIGEDSSKYVDYSGFIANHAIIDWFEKYGSTIDEDWEFYYPQLARRMYLNAIQDRGYDRETAEQIIKYLPQTDTKYISVNVSQMIKMFEAGKPPMIPEGCEPAKKKIADNEPDFWDTEPYSPMGARAEHQGYVKGLAETFRRLSMEKEVPVKSLVEDSGMTEETIKEVLELLENDGE